jgi:molecular chaperone HscB
MDFNADHFSLFELPASFRLDAALLDRRYLEMQSRVHPDRFASAGDAERRLSLQWATRVNEAYQTLKKAAATGQIPAASGSTRRRQREQYPDAGRFPDRTDGMARGGCRSAHRGEHHELEHLHHRLQRDMPNVMRSLPSLLDDSTTSNRRRIASGD